MYGYQCPYCGANLDPCERCDCQDQEEDTNKKAAMPPKHRRNPHKGDISYDYKIIP